MNPDIAAELNTLADDGGVDEPPRVLRAIAAGARLGGHLAVSLAELDEIAAEMSGPPWPR